VGRELAHVIERAAGQPDSERRHLIRHERGHAEAEQVAAPDRGGAQVIGQLRRHEDAVDREVQAPGALQAGDVPVVDDLGLVLGREKHDDPAEPGLRGPAVSRRLFATRGTRVVAVRLERPD
jgi:hypothetical protein